MPESKKSYFFHVNVFVGDHVNEAPFLLVGDFSCSNFSIKIVISLGRQTHLAATFRELRDLFSLRLDDDVLGNVETHFVLIISEI